MPEMDFLWNSPYPIDPDTGEPVMLSPEVEHAIDQESAMRNYANSQQTALMGKVGKMGGIERFLPWIAIGAVVLIGLFVYTMNQDIAIIKQAISDILNKVGY